MKVEENVTSDKQRGDIELGNNSQICNDDTGKQFLLLIIL
jgi:hypothetical protein